MATQEAPAHLVGARHLDDVQGATLIQRLQPDPVLPADRTTAGVHGGAKATTYEHTATGMGRRTLARTNTRAKRCTQQ
jgi:hypothetical protein